MPWARSIVIFGYPFEGGLGPLGLGTDTGLGLRSLGFRVLGV